MDYEINLGTLDSKSSELEELKSGGEDIYNEFNSCYLSTMNCSELSSLKSGLKQPVERIKKGYTNSNTWYQKYLKELKTLEDSLASFSASGITAPTEFKGEFVDMFGKVTMPIIKTGGDIHANAEMGKVKLSGNTTKDQIYNYLSSQGFSDAAICGIMANIEHESGFRTDALGDNGTSYGICQWHNSRWNNLKNFCNNNGYDWHSLEGQLAYLVHELKTNYQGVYNTLMNVPNTSQGAYDAAYKWTTDFEIPDNRYERGKQRGNTASSSYWNTYGTKV